MHNQKILIFKVGVVACCTPVSDVEAILTPAKLSVLPGQASFIAGVFQHRKKIVSVVDLRVKFGLQTFEQKKGRFVIARINDGLTGFWVDEILEITEAEEHHWQQVPGFVTGKMFGRTLLLDGKLILSTDFQRLYEMENAESLSPLFQNNSNPSNISDPFSSKKESSNSSLTRVNSVNERQKKSSISAGHKFNKKLDQQIALIPKVDKKNDVKSAVVNSTVVTDSVNSHRVKTVSANPLINRQQKNATIVGDNLIEKTTFSERLSIAQKSIVKADPNKIPATKNQPVEKLSNIRQDVIAPVENRNRDISLVLQENTRTVCAQKKCEDQSLNRVIPEVAIEKAATSSPGFPVTHETEVKLQSIVSSRFQVSAKGRLFVVLAVLLLSAVLLVYHWSHLGDSFLEDFVPSDVVMSVGDDLSMINSRMEVNKDADTAVNEKLLEGFQTEQIPSMIKPVDDLIEIPISSAKIASFSHLLGANSQKLENLDNTTEARAIQFQETSVANKEVFVLPVIAEWGMYSVVQGDTLWAISILFYRTPFRYPDLARWSVIENPDLIFPDEIVIYQKEGR